MNKLIDKGIKKERKKQVNINKQTKKKTRATRSVFREVLKGVSSHWLTGMGVESLFTLMGCRWRVWWFVSCGGRSNMGV